MFKYVFKILFVTNFLNLVERLKLISLMSFLGTNIMLLIDVALQVVPYISIKKLNQS